MKQRLWVALPWCLVAVLFFSGAGEAEKPVPKYMQLMLLEQQYESACTLLAIDKLVRHLDAISLEDEDTIGQHFANRNIMVRLIRLVELEQQLEPLRKRISGHDFVTCGHELENRETYLSDLKKILADMDKRGAPK